MARDKMSGARLLVCPLDLDQPAELNAQFTSREYGSKQDSFSACWTTSSSVPCKLRWAIIPVCAGDDQNARLSVMQGRQ